MHTSIFSISTPATRTGMSGSTIEGTISSPSGLSSDRQYVSLAEGRAEDELNRGRSDMTGRGFSTAIPILKDRHSEVDFIGRYSFDKASWYADLAKAGVAELSEASQMAQVEVYGTTMEQWRAHFPYKGGQTVWTYNTMGPVSSWNLIDWFGQPTAAFYAAQRAHEPLHVMLRTDSYSWVPGDTMRVAGIRAVRCTAGACLGTDRARVFDRQLTPVVDRSWDVRLAGGGLKNDEHPLAWQIPSDTPESYFFVELTLSDAAGARARARRIGCAR